MYTLKILDKADREFTDAAKWYEEKSSGLGKRFIEAIEKKLELVQLFPERYPKRKGNFREAPVRIFPYIIVYAFYKNEHLIVVYSIFHFSRNPNRKYKIK